MGFTIREQRPADASDGPDFDARHLHHSIESEFLALVTGPPREALRIDVEGDRLQVTHG
tara:strand:- start:151 stop:327 length:177 start_codon:yes stop_codon:yes gene_type:complete